MHLLVRNPKGVVTHVPLQDMVWRLEIVASVPYLGLGLRYVTSGTTALVMIAAWDIGTVQPSQEPNDRDRDGPRREAAEGVARVGLPFPSQKKNLDRFRESLAVLFNVGIRPQTVEEIIQEAEVVIGAYYGILQAIQNKATSSGTLGDWAWSIGPTLDACRWPDPAASSTPAAKDKA
jgi:hypothetical protein